MSKTGEIVWEEREEGLTPFVITPAGRKTRATWAPQPGSQQAFLSCPVFECLYEGTRGPGKTDALLMDFAQHVGLGFGKHWRGILFRRTFPELSDVIAKSKQWFPQLFPAAKYNEQKTTWVFPDGETLIFSYMLRAEDYWRYHGHAYPWIAWEELTTWPDDGCYRRMMSCSRSTKIGMPRKYRATTNPYGPGHNWVKLRFRLPLPPNTVVGPIIRDGDRPERVAIHGQLQENQILLHADPEYINKLKEAARNPNELLAWLEGSWDITAGGMFDDLWSPQHHVVPNLTIEQIPKGWRIDRSYDHGQSKPFSVGWWAESNGEPIPGTSIGAVPRDIVRIYEWYGWTGAPNEGVRMLASDIARGIRDREEDWGLVGRVRRGPADSSIFDQFEPNKSVAGDMQKVGIHWDPADKGPGSRVQGWERLRKLLAHAIPGTDGTRDEPGLFVCERCEHFRRTVPPLPRSDRNPDDVDTEAEDHVGDEVRYRVRHRRRTARAGKYA